MKRFQINSAKMLLPALLAVTLFSCVRKDNFFPSNSPSTRKAVVSILGGGTPAAVVKNPIDFVSTSQTILAIDLRRNANDAADLNTTMTVVVKDDTAAAHAVNPSYLFMPSSWYSFDSESPKVGGVGGTFTFVFKPGEFAKQIYIVIPNATLLDPSALYGFGFTITSLTGVGTISDSKSLVVEVGAKNAYDGIYTVTSGLVTRYTAPGVPAGDAISGNLAGNPDIYMITIGANTVAIPPSGNVGALYWANAAVNNSQVAGIDGIKITVDPSTNLTTALCSGYGANSNPTFGNWAGHTNSWTPGSKVFHLAWRWNPTANVREYEVVLTWNRPR